jgi:hypothetical protein
MTSRPTIETVNKVSPDGDKLQFKQPPQAVPFTGGILNISIGGYNLFSTSPCPVLFKDRFYVFWANTTGPTTGELWYATHNLAGWHARKVPIDTTMSGGPCAAVLNDDLYVFWPDENSSIAYATLSIVDGHHSWTISEEPIGSGLPPATGPTATVYPSPTPGSPNVIWLFWNDGSNDISYCYQDSQGQGGWSTPTAIGLTGTGVVQGSPCACVSENEILLIWNANSGGNQIYYTTYADGMWNTTGQQIQNVGLWPLTGPAVTIFNNTPWLFWKGSGTDSNGGIWYASYSGGHWGHQTQFLVPIQGSPAVCTARDFLCLLWNNGNATGPNQNCGNAGVCEAYHEGSHNSTE